MSSCLSDNTLRKQIPFKQLWISTQFVLVVITRAAQRLNVWMSVPPSATAVVHLCLSRARTHTFMCGYTRASVTQIHMHLTYYLPDTVYYLTLSLTVHKAPPAALTDMVKIMTDMRDHRQRPWRWRQSGTESDTERNAEREGNRRKERLSIFHTADCGSTRDMRDTVTPSTASDSGMSESSWQDFRKEPTEQLQLSHRR